MTKLSGAGLLARIFVGDSDRWHGKPLYEAIVEMLRESGLAGATVYRGMMGFGSHSRVHTAKLVRLSEDLPIVIEVVDTEEQINRVLPRLDEMVKEGLVTLEKVQVIKYRHRQENDQPQG